MALLAATALNRWFDNPDDWDHLDAAQALLDGSGSAWLDLVFGDLAHASVRPLPTLLWAVDRALWDWNAAGYFATNVALLAILSALVAALVARWRPDAPWVALAAGLVVGLSPAVSQSTWYLAARDDLLANTFFVGALLAWTVPRGRWGTAVLAGLGALCKPTLLVLPLVLLARDRSQGRGMRESLRRMAPTLTVLGLYLTLLTVVIAGDGGSGSVPSGGRAVHRALWNVVAPMVVPGLARHGGLGALGPDLPRLLVLIGIAALGWSAADRRFLGAGLALLTAGAMLPLPWLASPEFSIQDAGRYLQLPKVGFALVVAGGLLGLPPARRRAAALLLSLACGLSFWVGAAPDRARGPSPARALFDALGDHPGADTLIGMARLDAGATSLTGSDVLAARLGGDRPALFLQGAALLHRASRAEGERFSYGDFAVADPKLDLADLPPTARLLVDTASSGQRGFAQVQLLPGAFGPPGTRGDSLTLLAGETLDATAWIAPGALWTTLDRARRPPAHLATSVDVAPRRWCTATVEITVVGEATPARPGAVAFAVPSGRFALLQFSEQPQPADPFKDLVVLPLSRGSGRQRQVIHLRNAPSWLALPRIRWIGLTPVNHPGSVTVHGVTLEGC